MKRRLYDLPYEGEINNNTVSYLDWVTPNPKLNNWIENHWPTIKDLTVDGYLLQSNWMRDDTVNVSRLYEKRYFSYMPEVNIQYCR